MCVRVSVCVCVCAYEYTMPHWVARRGFHIHIHQSSLVERVYSYGHTRCIIFHRLHTNTDSI